ncbi:MAG TPA: mannitol dehydrogenase family protein [Beijerinckiaceae bacterium]|jgi:mannitol 2-dehydrogenase
MPHPLTLARLASLSGTIETPDYDRRDLRAGILHIGVGNFHRAHQAVYLDELLNAGQDQDWAILGAGLRPADRAMRDALSAQDWLTTVVEREAGASRGRVVGSMVGFVPVGEDGRAIVAALEDPQIRIVSLTVTEGGYCIDPATGAFDPNHPDIRHDAAHPEAPGGAFGVLVAALKRRRDRGLEPFAVLSCDNLPGNGHVAREATAGLADLTDRSLGDYVRDRVAFPDSMVDRITPATTDHERARVAAEFGIADAWPVACEPFRQWVIEDRFPAGRPQLERVGVTFTPDVAAYELMKIRILNGGHAALAYPAALLGLRFVYEAMADPLVRAFLDRLETREIIPCVQPIPGIDLQDYWRVVARRFANPEIGDTVARLCMDGSNRQPKFILPSTSDRLRTGGGIAGLALVSALWCRACAGLTEPGEALAIDDPRADRLKAAAEAARSEPSAFLALRDVFGDLSEAPPFREAFASALGQVWREGVRATLARYVQG